MRRPTVLLADDHAIVTDGLARILKEAASTWSAPFEMVNSFWTPPGGFDRT